MPGSDAPRTGRPDADTDDSFVDHLVPDHLGSSADGGEGAAPGDRADAAGSPAEDHPDGDSADDHEDDVVEAAFRQSTHEGIQRLNRSWPALLATGFVGGLDLGAGVLGMLVVRHETGSELLGALAFTFGFIALVLARSELFTENFLVPFAALISRNGTFRQVLRLWVGTAVMNLLGGWIIMALVVTGAPHLAASPELQELGGHFVELGIGWTTFASAVVAGAIMTLMTWMERGNREVLAKLVAAIGAGFLLAATPVLHSIVTSLEMFGAMQAGAAFGYADWLGIFGWAVLGNVVGGMGLVTMLRFLQVGTDTIKRERRTH